MKGIRIRPQVKRLESGYWLVRWSHQIWAQWPVSRPVRVEDFFEPDWSATPERLKMALALTEGIE